MTENETRRGPGRPPKTEIINDNNSINYLELSILEKIKFLINVLKQKIKYFSTKIIPVIILIIIFTIGIFLGRNSYVIDDYTGPKHSYMERIRVLHRSWTAYKQMKPDELHIAWLKFLKSYTYRRGGDPIMGQLDCLRACLMFWKSRGANIEVATIDVLARRFRAMADMDYTVLNTGIGTGDIIIFRHIHYEGVGSIPHIGIVQEVVGTTIKYMDFSPLGVGFPTVRRDSWQIQMIAEMSFPIWAGAALKK